MVVSTLRGTLAGPVPVAQAKVRIRTAADLWRKIRKLNDSDAARMNQLSDAYVFNLIKHGGAPVGRPGMPAFGYHLSDADIEALVQYVRSLPRQS